MIGRIGADEYVIVKDCIVLHTQFYDFVFRLIPDTTMYESMNTAIRMTIHIDDNLYYFLEGDPVEFRHRTTLGDFNEVYESALIDSGDGEKDIHEYHMWAITQL